MRKYHIKTALAIVIMTLASCSGIYENGQELAEALKPHTDKITADALRLKIEKGGEFLLIDVRQPNETEIATIPGAVAIPRGVLEKQIRNDEFWEEEYLYTPENNDEIIVYCQLGHRGALAAHSLKQLGFTNVKYLEGGIISWDPDIEKNSPKKSGGGGCGG